MKKTFVLTLAALAVLLVQSCSDFLDLKPASAGIAVENTSSDSVLYANAAEAEAALAGVYADFKNEYFQLDYYVNGDAQSDDAYAGADNPANFQIDDLAINAVNSNVSRDWAYLYSSIGKANTVINNVNDVADMNATRKQEIIAEASFIRAFMYFQIVQLWGDAPLQLKEVKTFSAEKLAEIYDQLFPPRVGQDAVYAQIIADLDVALAGTRATREHKGYVTKGAVNTLFAKVYAVKKDWTKVNQYCDAVIAGGYTLLPDFNQLWDNMHENSSESIFETNFAGGSNDGNWGTKMFRGVDWKKFNVPSNDLVATYDAENDKVRKDATIIFQDMTGKFSDTHWPQKQYPFNNKVRKFIEGSDANNIIFRLADVMLLKAEALNELGDVAGAATLVNQVRARVSLGATPASTQATMRLAIEKERRLELAFEGIRWFDIKRTGRAIEIMNAVKDGDGVSLGYNLTQEHTLWPIPQGEMDKNGQLTQNPGY